MSDEDPALRRSVDRRSLITKAAAAAGVGWTAPVVLGSLHTPAAAVTGVSYRARFDSSLIRDDSAGGGCVDTNAWNATDNFPGDIEGLDEGATVVFSFGPLEPPTCYFVTVGDVSNFGISRARCVTPGNNCIDGVTSIDGKTVRFTKAGDLPGGCPTGDILFYQLGIVCS